MIRIILYIRYYILLYNIIYLLIEYSKNSIFVLEIISSSIYCDFLMTFFSIISDLFGGFAKYALDVFQESPEVAYPRIKNFSIEILLFRYLSNRFKNLRIWR